MRPLGQLARETGQTVCHPCMKLAGHPFQTPPPKVQPELEKHVLPVERILAAGENKKIYAFCVNGSRETLRHIFNVLSSHPEDELYYQALLDCMTFSDHLLAYYDAALCDRVGDWLKAQLATASDAIKQMIWRILVIGWYKFARDAKQALEMLLLFIENSKPTKKPAAEVAEEEEKGEEEEKDKVVEEEKLPDLEPVGTATFFEKLLTTKESYSPLELFHLRFYHYAPSFYYCESLQRSKVLLYHVMLDSENLLHPVVINQDRGRPLPPPEEEEKKEEVEVEKEKDAQEAEVEQVEELDDDADSGRTTMVLQHKFRTTLLKRADKLFSFQQVDQSLDAVPPEAIVLREHKNYDWDRQSVFPVTEQYFAAPLCELLNEEMIDFDDPHLPKDNLLFLCQRYSSREAEIPEGASRKRQNAVLHSHLTTLREENADLRAKVFQSFMNGITQSLNEQDESGQNEFFWDEAISRVLISTFTRLVQSSLAVLHVQCTN